MVMNFFFWKFNGFRYLGSCKRFAIKAIKDLVGDGLFYSLNRLFISNDYLVFGYLHRCVMWKGLNKYPKVFSQMTL